MGPEEGEGKWAAGCHIPPMVRREFGGEEEIVYFLKPGTRRSSLIVEK